MFQHPKYTHQIFIKFAIDVIHTERCVQRSGTNRTYTPWGTVFLAKMTVAHLLIEVPAFHAARNRGQPTRGDTQVWGLDEGIKKIIHGIYKNAGALRNEGVSKAQIRASTAYFRDHTVT